MTFLLGLLGMAFGAWFCGAVFEENTGWTGALFGLLVGLLFGQLRTLRRRLAKFEQDLTAALAAGAVAKAAPLEAAAPAAPTVKPAPVPPQPISPAPIEPVPPVIAAVPAPAKLEVPLPAAAPAPAVAAPREPAPPPRKVVPPPPSAGSEFVERIKRWFTEGNVPVKVGIMVSIFGVGALLKYANDTGLLVVSIEFRLLGIALAALAALVFAWRKRESHRTFALSLQGGAIGVLILTIFGAYRLYSLLPPALTFALLIVVVAGAGLLAVLQDAMALAVLAIVGGFLAPVLASTGHGSHVALFGYYAVLNTAIFAIAWVKPWRALNLLGFAFTFAVGTAWGALQYQPELFATTEPFLLLFFGFYLLLPLLYALRQAPERRDLIDATLVFGTPLLALPLQAALLHGERMSMAWSALGAAAVYMPLAALELRRWRLQLLGEAHALLALGFATLAIPLAFSARSTACLWAVEGAAVLWVGLRQQRRVPRWIGYALQTFAGLAFFYSIGDARLHDLVVADTAILNGEFFGAVLIAVAGLVSARLIGARATRAPLGVLLFVWGWFWWLLAFGREIDRFAAHDVRSDWSLALFAATGVLGAEAFRRFDWREAAWPAIASFLLAPLFVILTAIDNHGVLEGWAAVAWALWLLTALRALADLAAHRWLRGLHFAFWWTVAFLLGVEFGHLADDHFALGDLWTTLAGLAPFAALFLCVLARSGFVRWPQADAAERARTAMLGSLAVVLGLAWFVGLFVEGDPAPLPVFVPLLNPLELAQLFFLVLLVAWYMRAAQEGRALLSAEARARLLAVALITLLTAITLRGAHFLGQVPWDESLWHSPLAQAALSIVWTLAGIAAMLLGKQRGSRAVWLGGAALMGVVIAKLLLIDRTHLHDLAAIIGVLVVGVLLVAVGYFAPAPPKMTGERT